MISDLILT